MGHTRLDNIEGVGPVRLEIFHRAGMERIIDLRRPQAAVRALLETAATALGNEQPHVQANTWRHRVKLCMAVADKLRNPDAAPFVPEHLTCSILHELLEVPVVASTGYTYEREAILNLVRTKLNANEAPVDHHGTPIQPLRVDAVDTTPEEAYIAPNYAVEDAIGYFTRHIMRFNILLKAPCRH